MEKSKVVKALLLFILIIKVIELTLKVESLVWKNKVDEE